MSDELADYTPRSFLSRKAIRFWDAFLSWFFIKPAREYEKKKCIHQNTSSFPSYAGFFTRYSRFGTERSIICCVSDYREDISLLQGITKELAGHFDTTHSEELAFAELYGKAVAYRTLAVGDTMPFPKASGELDTLTVDIVFDLWNEVTAYGMLTKNGEPFLLFRGTDLSLLTDSGRYSILSDFDPDGPGYSLFQNGKETLELWLQKHTSEEKKARAVGHSLGGVLVCYAMIDLHPYFSKINRSYAINYPGVSEALLEKWKGLCDTGDSPAFCGVVTDGDLVSKFGNLLEPTVVLATEVMKPPLLAHELLVFSEEVFSLHELDVDKENRSLSRQTFSKLHKGASSIFFEMGLKKILPKERNET